MNAANLSDDQIRSPNVANFRANTCNRVAIPGETIKGFLVVGSR